MSEPQKPPLLETLLALASTLAMAWCVMPPQERLWLKLSALQKLHRVSGQLARKAGHRGMGDELAGRDFQRYDIAYWLSAVRDRLERALEGMKP